MAFIRCNTTNASLIDLASFEASRSIAVGSNVLATLLNDATIGKHYLMRVTNTTSPSGMTISSMTPNIAGFDFTANYKEDANLGLIAEIVATATTFTNQGNVGYGANSIYVSFLEID